MPDIRYKPVTRLQPEKITMRNGQFAKRLASKHNVSSVALSTALKLICDGIIDALADGYNVNLIGLGIFESRELPSRPRYNRIKKQKYMSNPSVIVHFKKAPGLNKRLRKVSVEKLDKITNTPTIQPLH